MTRSCVRLERIDSLYEFAVRGVAPDNAESHIRQAATRYPGRSVYAFRWFSTDKGFVIGNVGGLHVPGSTPIADYDSLERSCPTCKEYSYAHGNEVRIRWPNQNPREELHAVKAGS